jgi:hypothetical protein
LSDLPALESEVSSVVEAAGAAMGPNQAASQARNRGARDALEPFNSRVAGTSYRFYWRPIVLEVPDQSTQADQQGNYYLVGVVPTSAAQEAGQSQTELLAFALVLVMFIALVPVIKLALLGPVDTMQAIEVAAICVGIVAATAIGTVLWIGSRDVLAARSAASTQVAGTARALVRNIERDLRDALFSPQMGDLSKNFAQTRLDELVTGFAPEKGVGSWPFVKVENTFLLDENGRQAPGTVMHAARDHVGANFDLSDRGYFTRALDEDFARTDGLAPKLSQARCDVWNYAEDGLVFDEIRSRTDGAPKTIMAAKLGKPAQSLNCPSEAQPLNPEERLQPSVAVAAFVMWRMVSPPLDPGVHYAVVDVRGAAGHRVLFHSDPYRAGVELFDESLSARNARTRARLSQAIGEPVACDLDKGPQGATVHSPAAKEFPGIYEGEENLFAVARVPCTDWAVVAFKPRRLVDSQAVKPVVDAIIVWASLTIIPYLLWMVVALRWGDHAWTWLWPDPVQRKKEAYRYLAYALAGAVILAIIFVKFAAPLTGFLVSAFAGVAALGWLVWVHYSPKIRAFLLKARAAGHAGDWPKWLSDRPRVKKSLLRALDALAHHKWFGSGRNNSRGVPDSRGPLDHVTEIRFGMFAVILLVAMSVVPVAALAADARAYFTQVSAAENSTTKQNNHRAQLRSWSAIARMEGVESPADKSRPASAGQSTARPRYFTERLRKAAGYDDRLEPAPAQPTDWSLGLAELRVTDGFTLVSLGLVIVAILGLAMWASMRGLFGFGIALEAVEYPQLKVKPDRKEGWVLPGDLPPRFLVIRASDHHLKALKRNAFEIDLNDDVRTGRGLRLPPNPASPMLLLIHNLGLLLGDPESRRNALERLEQILAKQFANHPERPNYRIAILTSLTPLERLLQSFERERDESDHLDEAQQSIARLERAKYREDMRWSAVFEQFTTYYHAVRPRPAPRELAHKSDAVKLIWEELEYIPDGAVAAMIWDPGPPVLVKEILNWAEKITEKSDPGPQAIIDYLASSLIEHYHLMWSLSSREERLLLYRIAHGHVPNIAKAYALRSLVKRGLVVLDPYPRTMNKSFAQFVRHVEKPETIKKWRLTQEHGFWDGARLLLALALPLAIGVLILAAIRNGASIAAIIPLFVAAGPAIIHALSSARRTAAA